MIVPYTAYRFTACHVLPSFARQRPLLPDFMTYLQKITAFFCCCLCPSNGVLIPLIVQGEIVRKNVWMCSCTSVLEREREREREREKYFRFRPQDAPSSPFPSLPTVYWRLQSVCARRTGGWLPGDFQIFKFPVIFTRIVYHSHSPLDSSFLSFIPPPQLLGSSMCLVTVPSTPTTYAIPTPETLHLSNVRNLTYSTGGLSLSWSTGRVWVPRSDEMVICSLCSWYSRVSCLKFSTLNCSSAVSGFDGGVWHADRRLRVFENRLLRRIFGSGKDEVTGVEETT
jgi:hypothetical protein